MSSIYDKDIKAIRKELVKFGKTTYGKTIFFISYLIPLSLFFAIIVFAILGAATDAKYLVYYMPHLFIGFVVTFVLANAYYYKELRIFVEHQSK
jgi:magnesium-transporting ATPase (P-type)